MMGIFGHHARRMTVALLWGLVVWLGLIVLAMLLVMH